jgi:hypothetical protein
MRTLAVREQICSRAVAEDESRAVVQLVLDPRKVAWRADRKVGRLREVLAQQALGVLVGDPLPTLAASQEKTLVPIAVVISR